MDLIRLNDDVDWDGNERSNPTFLPEAMIEGHSSLIWSERYSGNGEFERQSFDIPGTLKMMPITKKVGERYIPANTLVSLRDSSVPMLVETHQIDKSSNDGPKIITKGRSFETVLDRRTTLSRRPSANESNYKGTYNSANRTGQPYRPQHLWPDKDSDPDVPDYIKTLLNEGWPRQWTTRRYGAAHAAWYVIYCILRDNSWPGTSINPDAIPEIILKPSHYEGANWNREFESVRDGKDPFPANEDFKNAREYPIDFGKLYSWAISQINSENFGLRSIRPGVDNPGKIVVELYKGQDKRTEMAFDTRDDMFPSSTYLLSGAGWENNIQMFTEKYSREVNDGMNANLTGLDKRVTYFDATNIIKGYVPDKASPNAVGGNDKTRRQLLEIIDAIGQVELMKRLQTVMFSGEMDNSISSLYYSMVDPVNGTAPMFRYQLGDIVTNVGDYGLSKLVRVAEFIRSEDQNGEKAYPTFASIRDDEAASLD